jgi:class 3 adenylate cyclase
MRPNKLLLDEECGNDETGSRTHRSHSNSLECTASTTSPKENSSIELVHRHHVQEVDPNHTYKLSGSNCPQVKKSSVTERCTQEVLFTRNNNASIRCLRILTVLTLITATIIVASLTYSYTRSAEFARFESEYYDAVIKVQQAVASGMQDKLNVAKTFSAMYTSRYGMLNLWPNATMPYQDFKYQAMGQLEITHGIAISFNPIITSDNRPAFEAHATESAWMLGAEELVTRSCEDETGATCRIVADGIFRQAPNPDGEGSVYIDDPGYSPTSRFPSIMVPVWQIYPTKINWRAVMFNLHSEINRQRALDDMLQYQVPAITALLHLVQHDEINPSSILFYPVFDQLEGYEIDWFRTVVGSISIVFSWDNILKEVLPSYIEGVVVVLETSVSNEMPGQQWTYDVSGNGVSLLGEGDLHDPTFDKFEIQVKTSTVQKGYNDDEVSGVEEDLITYNMRFYPSMRFRKRYMSLTPFKMTLIVVCIFVLTSAIFLCYDYLLNHRQNAIMSFAAKAGRIVDNLFPTNVRDRLLRDVDNLHSLNVEDNVDEEHGATRHDDRPEKRQTIQKLLSVMVGKKHYTSGDGRTLSESSEATLNQNTTPIADLFEDTSIMFADIVGFTKWSSEHSPQDVFHLLEQLFFEFDKIAAKMNVFKLDRIGDCYIAVTGLPEEREDHCVVLCQFANECRSKMYDVIEFLKFELHGVEKLNMRFGIHSGPVIAGVLRGQKTRFELFGDTMNTASRMESLSLPGHIQISEEAAKLLRSARREHWIKPRNTLIHAKGKGKIQTYWLQIDEYSSTDGETSK